MSGYSVKEKDFEQNGKPEAVDCKQCFDTGFVETPYGTQECPLCGDSDSFLEAYDEDDA